AEPEPGRSTRKPSDCPGSSGSGIPKKLISRVRPGVLLENARRFWLASTLMADDLPALDRPTNATSAVVGGGNWSRRAAETVKVARCRMDNVWPDQFNLTAIV